MVVFLTLYNRDCDHFVPSSSDSMKSFNAGSGSGSGSGNGNGNGHTTDRPYYVAAKAT